MIDADPVARFDRLLGALFSGGLAHVKDSRTGGPPRPDPMSLGWTKDDVAQGRCIGWAEAGSLLLEPEGTYALVQDMATRQNENITLSRGTLWKRLDEAGRLLSRDGKYLTVRRQGLPGAGVRLRVLHFRWAPEPVPVGKSEEAA